MVLLVFLVHYESLLKPWLASSAGLVALADSLQAIGNCGVDLFFLLSGYLIYGSLLSRQQAFLRFFARRLIQPMITVAWSLSYEMFCYLALPAMVACLKLRDRSVSWRSTLFIVIAVALSIYTASNGGPVRLIMFISGIVLYEAIANSQLRASSAHSRWRHARHRNRRCA